MDRGSVCGEARSPRVIVIGAGMSGMLVGIRLLKAGITSFELLEKAHGPGGTWRENTYPGVQCDVPGYMYAYSFEPNLECSRVYATGEELQAYFMRVFDKYGLAAYTRFGTSVVSSAWEDGAWTVVTTDGVRRRADFVVAATGILHHPNFPEIPGLDSFAGETMHTARWRHDVALDGKRVGIIGTGSTSAQVVGAIAGAVGHLDVFQRTAQWIVPARDKAYGPLWRASVRRFPFLAVIVRACYSKYIENTLGNLANRPWVASLFGRVAKLNLRFGVKDAELRRKLTPDYKACCKRIVIADHFYPAIQQPNVSLVTEGIERIEPGGVRTRDGKLHELDVLVLATGFRIVFSWPIVFTGRDGVSLDALWKPGAFAYRTLTVPGFPNLFFMQGPHSPVGNFSLIDIAEVQADYFMQVIARFRRGEIDAIDPREDATRAFNASLREAVQGTIWASGCRSWYLDAGGVPALWPWSYKEYRESMKAPRWGDFVVSSRCS